MGLVKPDQAEDVLGHFPVHNAWLSKAQDQAGKVPFGMSSMAEQRLQTMHQLTGGITTPKVGNFWDKPKTDVIEVENVERKRLL